MSAVKEVKGGGEVGGSPPDLRHVLREKAANHRSFYRRLREKDKERGENSELQTPPPSPEPVAATLSLPLAMSGGGGLLSPPGRESPRSCTGSDEGCPGAADCSSDEDDRRCIRPDRPKSRDSAVDLDESPSLTVLSETLGGEDKSTKNEATSFDSEGEVVFEDSLEHESYCEEHCCYHKVRSKMILEAQYVEYPLNANSCETQATEDESAETDVFSADEKRRLSTLSLEGDEMPRMRMVRTPSVVVSDYSDDIHVGITQEELEYLRKHVETASNCSSNSSRRGSQLSVEDSDSRRNSQLSMASLDEVKHEVSPLVSEVEEDDEKEEEGRKVKKITPQ